MSGKKQQLNKGEQMFGRGREGFVGRSVSELKFTIQLQYVIVHKSKPVVFSPLVSVCAAGYQ